jgi:hypothetical protein
VNHYTRYYHCRIIVIFVCMQVNRAVPTWRPRDCRSRVTRSGADDELVDCCTRRRVDGAASGKASGGLGLSCLQRARINAAMRCTYRVLAEPNRCALLERRISAGVQLPTAAELCRKTARGREPRTTRTDHAPGHLSRPVRAAMVLKPPLALNMCGARRLDEWTRCGAVRLNLHTPLI